MNLYQITQEASQLASLLETEELTAELEAMLVINQQELTEKSINYAKVIKNLEADSDAIDNEIKRLKAMKESKDLVVSRMKEAVKNAMLVSGIDKIESSLFKLSLRRSEAIQIVNEEQLSPAYIREKIVKTPDKELIKSAIKAGKTVEGAVLSENFNLQLK